jgi:hypothetical protein
VTAESVSLGLGRAMMRFKAVDKFKPHVKEPYFMTGRISKWRNGELDGYISLSLLYAVHHGNF